MPLAERIGSRPAAYVEEVVARVKGLLGEGLVGAWLLGSAALGDFAPERSDLDVQAVSSLCLARGDRERLAAALSHDALPCPVRGLEFVLYRREDLDQSAGPAFQINLNTGRRTPEHVAFHPDEDPRFWFVIDASIAHQSGLRLAGPSAAEVFPPLPRPLVAGALREALAWYAQRDASGAETVLSACRAWSWASDGRWRSKAEAARWAGARLPDPAPVEKALQLRDSVEAPALSRSEVEPVLGAARAALEKGV
jgi:Domain of unknown function (DUF4111)